MRLAHRLVVLATVALLAMYFHKVCTAGEDFRNYSADMVSSAGGETVKGKMYLSGEKIRVEVAGSVMITRLDKSVSWMLMPAERMYMEQPIDRNKLPKASKEFEGETERVSLGKEMVDGKPAEKFKVTYTQNGAPASAYQWVLDSGFPVKMAAVNGSWSVEYRNVVFSAQPDSLFEPPADYQKFDMPSMGGAGIPSLGDIMSQAEKSERP